MFIGTYSCSVDAKGRLMLPSKFRDKLNDKEFYLAKGIDDQIEIYTAERFQVLLNNFSNYNEFDENANSLKRRIVGSAQEGEMDKQGRLNINIFKAGIGLDKKATVVGMVDKIEIWATEVYEAKMNADQQNIRQIAKDLLNK